MQSEKYVVQYCELLQAKFEQIIVGPWLNMSKLPCHDFEDFLISSVGKVTLEM